MTNKDVTLEQIQNQEFYDMDRNTDIVTDTYIIQRYDDDPDKYDVYTHDQAEDSDPNPIITGTAEQIYQFLQNN